MSISKVRLPNNTEEDIKAKYLIQSTSSDATSAEFYVRTVTEDAIANIQKIYGNTVVVSNNLVSNNATAILSRGFNQWDEEWEVGFYSLTSGNPAAASDSIRSKNKIKILPNTSYYGAKPSGKTLYKFFYDANGSFISEDHGNQSVSPANAAYMNIALPNLSPAIYANNICINISDPAKNGTYEPYNGHQIDLNIPTLTGKLNGAGSSVVIFPNGMQLNGTTRDELTETSAIKRIADDNSVLATPQTYILDNALQLQYPVVAGGTEMVLPTTGTAPMKMDVIYGNAADATSNLSSNFISVDSMKAFLNNLGTQMGGTWNMQYNNGKFEFTFSSS